MEFLTETREKVIFKFGGLFAILFLTIVVPGYGIHKLVNQLADQQRLHDQYVQETNATISGLSTRVDTLGKEYQKTASFKKEATCLADNIYHEIGTQSEEGMKAVAQVTLNRKREGFANTICGVVHQKTGDTCQFSWVCNPLNPPNPSAYHKAYDIAKKSLTNGIALGKLNEALYYHADYVKPSWSHQMRYITQIGPHVFYKDRDGN
jgi:spore germination cell wall hydrolase CwlJ-like protein